MNITIQLALLMLAVILRKACDIKRAWSPILESPISPSISPLGVKAATESITIRSTAPERIRASAISRACSPLSGCVTNRFLTSTPKRCAYTGSKACSASIKAAVPLAFCTSAIACRVRVVLPDDSGPYISITRPLG